jgi:hypothetical protein
MSATLITVLYDEAARAVQAEAALEILSCRGAVRRLGSVGQGLAALGETGLPRAASDRYLNELARGRTMLLLRAEADHVTPASTLFRRYGPVEIAVHQLGALPVGV